ncbi:MAG: heavy-metal-associated domain-containing protein [Burkholderiaceae bacterium]
MKTTLIKVTGMKNEECVRLVTNAIQDLPGIGHVALSLVNAEASVEHGSMVSEEDIRQAILDAGFDAS